MAPYTCQHFILPDFLNFFGLICVKWSFTVALIYISFITAKAKHIFKCFFGYLYFLFWSFLHIAPFSTRFVFLIYMKFFTFSFVGGMNQKHCLNFVNSFLCCMKVLYFNVVKFINLLRTSCAFRSFFRKSFPTLRL